MTKKMLIDATHAEETRVVVVDGTKVEEFDFETVNRRQLAGNIYLAKVTRVEPSLQAAFVDYGGNRHGFLAFAEIHPDYYQIPAADRAALIEEDRVAAEAEDEEPRPRRSRRRGEDRPIAAAAEGDATNTGPDIKTADVPGMEMIDPAEAGDGAGREASNLSAPLTQPEGARPDRDDIEAVGDDSADDLRPARRPRARRYKIQEVIKVRQIMLVQVVKEERGNKGAALTTYLSLAGRYCVLMPNTARGGGISRKITVAADRKKLKEIASELEVPQGAGLIIRTAGSQRTRTEIRRDYEYLMRLWEQIRDLTFKSIAPAPIYEEGDLIKRTIRDLYSKEIDEVLVEGERGYRTAKDFMRMIMPSHAKNVKHYTDPMPLFARYQVESYLGGMFNPVVQLKSGGYIVIGVTEALVAIDVNSGRATKEGSIEDTAFKTNCEAADEIARQLRLRDLAGLIVIDFIDMDERKNNAAVEKRFKERLKTDRARLQVGRISGFGLLEMSRQRLRPGMLESTTQPCPHCHGTGLIRSDDSMALTILRAIEEEGTRKRSREVLVKAPVAVVNFLMNMKREHIINIEARYGMAVRVEADPTLISPDFSLEKFKQATRLVGEVVSPVVSVDAKLMASIDEEREAEPAQEEAVHSEAPRPDEGEGEGKKRRRRRRRRGRQDGEAEDQATPDQDAEVAESQEAPAEAAQPADAVPVAAPEAEKPRKSRSRSRNRKASATGDEPAQVVESVDAEVGQVDQPTEAPAVQGSVEDAKLPPVATVTEPLTEPGPKKSRSRSRTGSSRSVKARAAEESKTEAETAQAPSESPKTALDQGDALDQPPVAQADEAADLGSEAVPADDTVQETVAVDQQAPTPEVQPEPAPDSTPAKPKAKRRGWWSA